MRSATCQLAIRGKRVLGLEKHDPAHDTGSHGHSRILHRACFENPSCVPLLLQLRAVGTAGTGDQTRADDAQVAFAAGFSGHGYKFAGVIGGIPAELTIDGATRHTIDLFSPIQPSPQPLKGSSGLP